MDASINKTAFFNHDYVKYDSIKEQLFGSDNIIISNAVGSNDELQQIFNSTMPSLASIFTNWYKYQLRCVANISYTDYVEWSMQYNGSNGINTNSSPLTTGTGLLVSGLIAQQNTKSEYNIEININNPDPQHTGFGILVGYLKDSNNVEHTLTVTRSASSTLGYNYTLTYDLGQTTEKILMSLVFNNLITQSSQPVYFNLSISKTESSLLCYCSDLSTVDDLHVPIQENYELKYILPSSQPSDMDLTTYTNISSMMNSLNSGGFLCFSNQDTANIIVNIVHDDGLVNYNNKIYDLFNDKYYEYLNATNTWELSPYTLHDNYLQRNTWLYNPTTDKLFYYKWWNNFIEIIPDVSGLYVRINGDTLKGSLHLPINLFDHVPFDNSSDLIPNTYWVSNAISSKMSGFLKNDGDTSTGLIKVDTPDMENLSITNFSNILVTSEWVQKVITNLNNVFLRLTGGTLNGLLFINSSLMNSLPLSTYDNTVTTTKWVTDEIHYLMDNGLIVNWTPSTNYSTDGINGPKLVLYNNALYLCQVIHTSSSTFNPSYWKAMTLTQQPAYVKQWTSNTKYSIDGNNGDLVCMYNNILYICQTNHTSSPFFTVDLTAGYWKKSASSTNSTLLNWTPSTNYYLDGDSGQNVVLNNNILYAATKDHISSNSFAADLTAGDWIMISTSAITSNISTIIQWSQNTNYFKDPHNGINMVYIPITNKLYLCQKDHTSSSSFVNDMNAGAWVELSPSIDTNKYSILHWSTNTQYYTDPTVGPNIILYNNDLYLCLSNHTSTVFTTDYNNGCWLKLTNSSNTFIEKHSLLAWEENTSYYEDGGNGTNVVLNNNELYVCQKNHTSSTSFTNDLAAGDWILVSSGGSGNATPVPAFYGINDWSQLTNYYTSVLLGPNIVIYNNNLYLCLSNHTSGTSFDTDFSSGKWKLLSYEQITQPHSVLPWYSNKPYVNDGSIGENIVNYNNTIYFCIVNHTSSTSFTNDLNSGYWKKVSYDKIDTAITTWETGNIYYNDGLTGPNLTIYNNNLYLCLKNNTASSSFTTDFNNGDWKLLNSSSTSGILAWASDVNYNTDGTQGINLVLNNNKLYQCIVNHTSSASFTNDLAAGYWFSFFDATAIVPWKPNTIYNPNGDNNPALCIYNNHLYLCRAAHKSSDSFAPSNWIDLNPSDYRGIKAWASSTVYSTDGTNGPCACLYNNSLYICLKNHTSSTSFTTDLAAGDWVILNVNSINSYNILPWKTGTNYYADGNNGTNVCIYNEHFYLCLINHTSGTFATDLAAGDWKDITGNTKLYTEVLPWVSNTSYSTDGTVGATTCIYNNHLYLCQSNHTSSNFSYDLANGKWKDLSPDYNGAKPWSSSTNYSINGQAGPCLCIYANSLYLCQSNHTSGTSFTTDLSNGKWVKITSNGGTDISTWSASTNYSTDGQAGPNIILYNNDLYLCLVDHLSSAAFTTDYLNNKWKILTQATVIKFWSSGTNYSTDGSNGQNIVIYQEVLFLCIVNHISSSAFMTDFNKGYWRAASGGTSGDNGIYSQVVQLSATANQQVLIPINKTESFLKEPIDVLKYSAGSTGQTINITGFDTTDQPNYLVNGGAYSNNNQYVLMNGTLSIVTNISVNMSTLSLISSNGYYSESDLIDFSSFKQTSGISLV